MLSSKLKPFIARTGLVLLGLSLGAAAVNFSYLHEKPRRSVASLAPYKPHGLILGKQGAAMNVEIVGPASYPENPSDEVELVGFLTQHLAADSGLSYTWALPEGVELVEGSLSSNFQNLPLGVPHQVRILVRGFSKEKQKSITLNSQLIIRNTPLTASAIIVSRPEDTLEARVMDLQAQAKAAAEEAKANPNSDSR